MRSKLVTAGGNGNVFVQMQRLAKKLIHDIMWERVDLSHIVKEHADTGCPLAIDQLASSIRVVVNKTTEVQLAYVKQLSAGRDIEHNYRWLFVSYWRESDIAVQVSCGHA